MRKFRRGKEERSMHSQTVCGEEHVHGPQCDTQLHMLSWQQMVLLSVYWEEFHDATAAVWDKREKIVWLLGTSLLMVEMFGGKIST